jgi:hypothetical protein
MSRINCRVLVLITLRCSSLPIHCKQFIQLFSPEATKAIQRYEDCFKASLLAAHSSRPKLIVRFVDYIHIIPQIIQYCVSKIVRRIRSSKSTFIAPLAIRTCMLTVQSLTSIGNHSFMWSRSAALATNLSSSWKSSSRYSGRSP